MRHASHCAMRRARQPLRRRCPTRPVFRRPIWCSRRPGWSLSQTLAPQSRHAAARPAPCHWRPPCPAESRPACRQTRTPSAPPPHPGECASSHGGMPQRASRPRPSLAGGTRARVRACIITRSSLLAAMPHTAASHHPARSRGAAREFVWQIQIFFSWLQRTERVVVGRRECRAREGAERGTGRGVGGRRGRHRPEGRRGRPQQPWQRTSS